LQKLFFLQQIAPLFGYLASLALIIALLVKTDLKFRLFNTGGNIFFIIYALIINAYPVLVTNVILISINIFYLVKLYRKVELFDLLECTNEEKLVSKFLCFYEKDIQSYFPQFEAIAMKDSLTFLITRNLDIANIFSAAVSADGDAQVVINYTVPKYRDYKVGRYIFEKEKDRLIKNGIKRIVYSQAINKQHEKFLKVMGFVKSHNGQGYTFIKTI
jgi:Bacterial inner membrane protein